MSRQAVCRWSNGQYPCMGSVGGAIVLRDWENLLHGEGRQGADGQLYLLATVVRGTPCEPIRGQVGNGNLMTWTVQQAVRGKVGSWRAVCSESCMHSSEGGMVETGREAPRPVPTLRVLPDSPLRPAISALESASSMGRTDYADKNC